MKKRYSHLLFIPGLILATLAFMWFTGRSTTEAPDEASASSQRTKISTADTIKRTTKAEPGNTDEITQSTAQQAPSPFSVVEEGESQTRQSATEPESAAATPAPSQVTVVPTSYPVTDAEKYFVPKEDRRPGNLGGPPPLNFPGGPSDPNRSVPPEQ